MSRGCNETGFEEWFKDYGEVTRFHVGRSVDFAGRLFSCSTLLEDRDHLEEELMRVIHKRHVHKRDYYSTDGEPREMKAFQIERQTSRLREFAAIYSVILLLKRIADRAVYSSEFAKIFDKGAICELHDGEKFAKNDKTVFGITEGTANRFLTPLRIEVVDGLSQTLDRSLKATFSSGDYFELLSFVLREVEKSLHTYDPEKAGFSTWIQVIAKRLFSFRNEGFYTFIRESLSIFDSRPEFLRYKQLRARQIRNLCKNLNSKYGSTGVDMKKLVDSWLSVSFVPVAFAISGTFKELESFLCKLLKEFDTGEKRFEELWPCSITPGSRRVISLDGTIEGEEGETTYVEISQNPDIQDPGRISLDEVESLSILNNFLWKLICTEKCAPWQKIAYFYLKVLQVEGAAFIENFFKMKIEGLISNAKKEYLSAISGITDRDSIALIEELFESFKETAGRENSYFVKRDRFGKEHLNARGYLRVSCLETPFEEYFRVTESKAEKIRKWEQYVDSCIRSELVE